ncbi:DUF4249 domain-containing protein [Nafulsella turpanensis]|uniref:DUF4249 domain-containing protein n=1 Tax=Nafulsella turpanensis TaxID=1265690 RepID=UPI00034AB5BD|nr:DUF4249 domain-containing protein [Nafulsella turpanensis]
MEKFFSGLCFRITCSLLLGLWLTACVPDPLEVEDIPAVKPEIVVSTQLTPDNSIVIWLTRTFGALEASEDSDPEEVLRQIAVADALVTITGPAGTDTLKNLESGLYGGLSIPFSAGETYELRVESESLGVVTATTTVQEQVSFEAVAAELNVNMYDDTLAEVSYSFLDPAQKNYYMINVQHLTAEDFIRNAISPNTFTLLLDDASFKESRHSEEIDISEYNYGLGDTVAVSLSSISADYYEFMKLRTDQQLDFIQFLSEPLNYPSNVMGGKGFFHLSAPDTRTFIFRKVK